MLTAWTSSALSGVNYMCINIYQVKLQLEGSGPSNSPWGIGGPVGKLHPAFGFTQTKKGGLEGRTTTSPPALPYEAPVGDMMV